MERQKNFMVFDFETTGKKFLDKYNKAEVRMVATSQRIYRDSSKIDPKIRIDYDVNKWFQWVMGMKDKSTLYANNLSKFDGEFLLEIIRKNHKYIDSLSFSDFAGKKPKGFRKIINRHTTDFVIGNKAVQILMSDTRKIFNIKIRTKTNKIIYFKCLLNLMNISVKNMIKSLKMGKEFDSIKGNENYDHYDCDKKEFNRRLKDPEFKQARESYIKLDVLACYRYIQRDRGGNPFSPFEFHRQVPLTIATHSFNTMKKNVRKEFSPYKYKSLWVGVDRCELHDEFHPTRKCWKEKYVKRFLDSDTYELFATTSKGGFTFLNDKYKGQILNNVYSADVNSHYPAVYDKYPVPCGKPLVYEKEPSFKNKDNLYAYYVEIKSAEFMFDSDVFPPMLSKGLDLNSIKGRYVKNFHQDKKVIHLMLWEKEFNLIKKYYKLDMKIAMVYEFRTSNVFGKAMKPLTDIKFNAPNGAQRDGAKLIINAAYGKWGEKQLKMSKIVVFDKGKIKITDDLRNMSERNLKYPPVASYISSMGRVILYEKIEQIIELGGIVIYGDTDSIKYIDDIGMSLFVSGIGDKLGEWDMEWKDAKFKYLAPKAYVYKLPDGIWKSKMKGYNKHIEPNELYYGKILVDKTQGVRVAGGKVISDTLYTINENQNLVDC